MKIEVETRKIIRLELLGKTIKIEISKVDGIDTPFITDGDDNVIYDGILEVRAGASPEALWAGAFRAIANYIIEEA